ncbi:MAG: hypothetical protein ACO2OU_06790 [Thermus aquaticus]|uniref:hypothetical protein n=1 Tax=Thermus aquaticus TaxID=271 RepID=UPI003C0FDB58
MEDLLSWDVPFDHLEAPQGLASRVEAVEKEGVRAWREGRLLLDLGKGEAWARWA